MTDDVSTNTDLDTTEHLMNREPEIMTEEPLVFLDGEVTTRSGLENDGDEDSEPVEDKKDKEDEAADAEEEVDEVTKLKAELESEREKKRAARRGERRLKEENAKLRHGADPVDKVDAKSDQAPPQWEDFDDPNDWFKAMNKHNSKQVEKSSQPAEQATPELQAAISDLQESRGEGARKYADYEALVYQNHNLPITDQMLIALSDMDTPEDVAYYLGRNPEEAAKISKLGTGRDVTRALTKIEAMIESGVIKLDQPDSQPSKEPAKAIRAAAPKPSGAPKPMSTIGGGEAPNKDPASMSQREYEVWRKR